MTEFIKKIISEAIYAPSGGNSQPWRFEIKNEKLFIYNLPNKDNAILNFKQTGSYIAHGCLIENISIISDHYGYKIDVNLFAEASNENLIAIISFEKNQNPENNLFEYIKERHTNRKIYHDKKIDATFKREVSDNMHKKNGLRLIITEDKYERMEAAKCASIMEKIALENQILHKAFFKEILWKEDDNNSGKEGLYIKTLELPIPVQYFLKLIRIWPFAKFLSKTGFPKIVAKGDAETYGGGGGIGIITMENYDPQKFIEVGRMMQKIWLTATKYKLSIQPIAGIIFLAHRIYNSGDTTIFDEKHTEEIKKTYKNIQKIFDIKEEAVFMFRIGYADNPTSRSGRQTPEIKTI